MVDIAVAVGIIYIYQSVRHRVETTVLEWRGSAFVIIVTRTGELAFVATVDANGCDTCLLYTSDAADEDRRV